MKHHKTISVDLPYPIDPLWPNKRPRSKAYFEASKAKARKWAFTAAGAGIKRMDATQPIKVHVALTGKQRGPYPDNDNIIAACKAYFDGIATAIMVDDRHFQAPTVSLEGRSKHGSMIITLEATQ